MLPDCNMKKKDLREATGITNYAIRQLTNDENMTTEPPCQSMQVS